MNQDYFVYDFFDDKTAYIVVCDGMGGANAGNIASKTATLFVQNQVRNGFNEKMDSKAIKRLLENAVSNANLQVFSISTDNENYSGMGTTILAAIIKENVLHLVHAGDSRAYLIKDSDEIVQLSKDHSIVQNMIEKGLISKDEARIHPKRNVITRALGVSETLELDYIELELGQNDKLLLCTDGLTGFVDDLVIKTIIGNSKTEIESVERLIQVANDNGGKDNITAVLATI